MLELLTIRNLALIEHATLEFAPGINVFTGESGAGKSLVLRALGLILGGRGGAELVRPGADRAVVEALFVAEDGSETILRREITAAGRSRSQINGQLSPQAEVAALAQDLILITGQHGQQRLLAPQEHVRLVDAFLDDPTVLSQQHAALEALRQAEAALAEVDGRVADLQERRDFLEYQLGEIRKVAPRAGEEEELLALRENARSTAKLQDLSREAHEILRSESGLLAQMGALERVLHGIDAVRPQLPAIEESLSGLAATREHLTHLERTLGQMVRDADTVDLDQVERRLFELQSLSRRLRRPIEELVRLEEEISANLSYLDAADLERRRLVREKAAAQEAARRATHALDEARAHAADRLTRALVEELTSLGFPEQVAVFAEFSPVRVADGVQELRPRFLWAPNPGLPPQPLDRIASGGELSRFLLAVTGLLAAHTLPTLVFDEIDAGIGGATLLQVAARIRRLAERQQILLVTHWPQLAQHATRHFSIQKIVENGVTQSICRLLDDAQRRAELARMAGEEPL
ncbi:MAG: recombination protein RecN [Desulfomicrobiaceae bacterium]|jgi:DNA repair protein RecN (Recombination protein N)|nr:AAA family ATPase [Desulfomicrobiaceae bacterium]MBZ4648964.1 recombination protein RecN [Desulfomicrobiaceae bacterium]MBZ4685690.1 recombination protein RecN [Desulfomicrobiaceae bacterium]MDI3493456.1 repair protein RecN [Desulfomicrobiaceae bacterium]MDK2874095.1 repair protein RecN [Desulfomicrobiaceae bacterium]